MQHLHNNRTKRSSVEKWTSDWSTYFEILKSLTTTHSQAHFAMKISKASKQAREHTIEDEATNSFIPTMSTRGIEPRRDTYFVCPLESPSNLQALPRAHHHLYSNLQQNTVRPLDKLYRITPSC